MVAKEEIGLVDEADFKATDPDKKKEEFRNYTSSARQARVEKFYTEQHALMTYDLGLALREKHLKLDKAEMSIWEALEFMDSVVDDSDPDTNLSQMQHALQSAEAIRKKFPGEEYDWFHLVGLLHDLGKLLAVTDESKKLVGEPQWCVVGDTFPLGCRFDESNIFVDKFKDNPDYKHPVYSTELGIYKAGCGFSNMTFSFGHDEYLYQVFVKNGCKLPPQALYVIRFHSFYPWHSKKGYEVFADETDREMLKWLKEFQQFDLYSKADESKSREELEAYYKGLIKKYFPDKLRW